MKRLRTGLACLGLLFVTACAGLQRPETGQDWSQHRARLAQLEQWTAEGKIALRAPEQSETATLNWRQQGDATHIQLSGPLGLNLTTLDSDGKTLEIRQGDDYSRWQLDDPALQDNPAWQLPLAALHHWLKGAPAPQLPVASITLDESGQLPTQIRQQGWTIDYEAFERFENYPLPTRLRLYRDDTSARIILRRWGGFAGQ